MNQFHYLFAFLYLLVAVNLAFAACGTSQTQDAVISTYDSRCTCNNAQATCQCTLQNSATVVINFSLFNGFWTTSQTVNVSYDGGVSWTTWPGTIPARNTLIYQPGFTAPSSGSGTQTTNMIIKQFDANNPSSCWTRSFTVQINYMSQSPSGCQYNNPPCDSGYDCINNQCVKKKCADGTEFGSCSSNKPKYCIPDPTYTYGTLIDKASICGCPTGQVVSGEVCTTPTPSGCQYNNPPCSSNYQCINNQCVAMTCSDGTIYGACSSNKPKYCSGGTLIDKASTCGCPDLYVKSGEKCVWPTCSDGTRYGECSTTKPEYCSGGTLIDKASICGCPSNYETKGESCVPRQCSDGTPNNQCSSTKPKYCIDGNLVDKASSCGCPSSDYDISGESCVLKPGCQYNNPPCGSDYECVNNGCIKKKCADGTNYSECSVTKPKYCSSGGLINKASVCGCESDYNAIGENCVLKEGCAYHNPDCASDLKCVDNQCVPNTGVKNRTYSTTIAPEELRSKINVQEIKNIIKEKTGKEVSQELIDQIIETTTRISKDVKISASIKTEDDKTTLYLVVKYTGNSKINNFYFYDEVPKSFATSASEITVDAPGADVKIVQQDPVYMFVYPSIEPNEEKLIGYTVNKPIRISTIDTAPNPMFFAETTEAGIFGIIGNIWSGYGIPIIVVVVILAGVLFIGGARAVYRGMTRPKAEMQVEVQEQRIVTKAEKVQANEIAISNLTLRSKKGKILDDVSFSFETGQLCAIVGPSGSGKSMIIECIAGRKNPSSGSISVLGRDAKTNREEINKLIGFVPQHAEVNMGQTVWQNMMNSAIKWNIQNAEEKTGGILKHLNLYDRKDLSAKNLSGGQLKLLSVGMELMREPPILLLDEPTTGLDPTSRGQIISVLSRLVTHFKRTVIMSSHFMDELDECDIIAIIKGGRLIAIEPPEDLKRKMPGRGKIVSISLEKVTDELIKDLSKLPEVRKVIQEGRTLKILMDSPNPVPISQKISEFGGFVEEAKIEKATMKEVFIYYTGAKPED